MSYALERVLFLTTNFMSFVELDVTEKTQAVYNRLVQDVLHNWHARLWHNAFKDSKFDSFSGKKPTEDVREFAAVQGPAKLFQSVDSIAYFNYL